MSEVTSLKCTLHAYDLSRGLNFITSHAFNHPLARKLQVYLQISQAAVLGYRYKYQV